MFKKLLTALLPVAFIFSVANFSGFEAQAGNQKIHVRVDFLEEGTNNRLAESTRLAGDEGVFAKIAIPQNLVNNSILRRDFSAESKQLIAANKLYDKELVYQVYFAKKANPVNNGSYTQTAVYYTAQTQKVLVAQAAVQKQLVASGSFGYSTTTSHTVVTNHKPTVVTTYKPATRKPVAVAQKPAAQRPVVVTHRPATHRPAAVHHNTQPTRKAPAAAKRRGR